jgi:type II secretory pathway component PulC
MGLKNEDIILRANNVELNSPGDGVKIFNMIKELDRMDLDIIRNGSPMTQVYHIN